VSLHGSMQKEFDEWKAEFAAKSEMERRALSTRQRIEQMMELHCPQCRHVFGAFDGCAALRCATANCGANFCAFCLADCGDNAHPHVVQCSLNPTPGEYSVSEADWTRVVEDERRRKLEEFWGTLDPELKEAMAADVSVRQILRDLRLDGRLVEQAFNDEMAQLRGMGFTDEPAMRRALGEARGDLAAAVERLL